MSTTEDSYRRWKDRIPKKGKRKKVHFSSKKKPKDDAAYEKILSHLKGQYKADDGHKRIYAEKISIETNIRENIVRKVLMRMNRNGLCSNRILWGSGLGAMHTRNDPWGDDPVQWEAKYFNLYTDKLHAV